MNEYVFDSSALLALLFREPGADVVSAALDGAVMSNVNIAEVVSKMIDRGAQELEIRKQLRLMKLAPGAFDFDAALLTGLLRQETRKFGLSLGDRACLATAMQMGAKVLTADRQWKGLKIGVEIEFVR